MSVGNASSHLLEKCTIPLPLLPYPLYVVLQVRDQHRGEAWYFNPLTGQSQWDRPESLMGTITTSQKVRIAFVRVPRRRMCTVALSLQQSLLILLTRGASWMFYNPVLRAMSNTASRGLDERNLLEVNQALKTAQRLE